MRILCCPARSPNKASSRLLGGIRKSCKLMAALIWSSLRVATRLSDAGRFPCVFAIKDIACALIFE